MRPGRVGAALVLVGLAGGAAYAGGMGGGEPTLATSVATSTTSVSRPEPAPGSVTSRPEVAVTSTSVARASPERVAREGMEAWGRFAVTGDLEQVAPWFSSAGPQWAQFQAEAPDLASDPLGDPPYTVLVEDPVTHQVNQEARVEARVTFVRTGEPSQGFRWTVILVREGEEWVIWTVEDGQADSPSSSMATP